MFKLIVSIQVALHVERGAAQLALVGPLSGVRPHVVLPRRLSEKRLATVGTRELSHTHVSPPQLLLV